MLVSALYLSLSTDEGICYVDSIFIFQLLNFTEIIWKMFFPLSL